MITTQQIRLEEKLKDLILNVCNEIGCKNCHYKWETDVDGNSCRADELQDELMKIEAENYEIEN